MGQPSLPMTEVAAVTDLSSPLPEIATETPAPVGPPIAETQAPVGPPIASRTVPPATETPDVPSATVVDATTLLPALRQHCASIAAAPPQESALRTIADICVDRNSVDWLDDMLDERHGTSLTSFRQRQRSFQQAKTMRSILGLPVPVMQDLDTPTPTATPPSAISTPAVTPVITPTTTIPTVEPEPASTFIPTSVHIECSVCAQGKPPGQFSTKQRRRSASDRHCKQCQVDCTDADSFNGIVRAALTEQATRFEAALCEQTTVHAAQLQSVSQSGFCL